MTVALVLGAGASMAFGYPSGAGLRNDILNLELEKYRRLCISSGIDPDQKEFKDFIKAFRYSDMASIDAFLARRTEFAEIGKKAIATVLLSKENLESFDAPTGGDNWASYLHRHYSAETWEQLDYSNLKIISFNYDRSFEHYMIRSIRYTYKKGEPTAIKKLRELEIIHVYGSLGPTLSDDENYISFASGASKESVLQAAESLKVIREGNNADDALVRAREILTKADVVAFAGFSFDSTNMERLNARITCAKWPPEIGRTRNIYASCYGMTRAEARRAASYFGSDDGRAGMPIDFVNGKCIDLFRETLLLG